MQEIAKQDFPKDLVQRIDESKVYTKNVIDRNTKSTKSILEWCDSTAPLLNQLISGNDGSTKSALATKLNEGIQKTSTMREEISYNNLNLNRISGTIVSVVVEIAADFDNKTIEFQKENHKLYEHLENKVQNLHSGLDELKSQMRTEVGNILDLRVHIENVKEYLNIDVPELRDDIRNSAEELNAKCVHYHEIHA